jgi:low molecular weight protein-tyrosine phosphatase
MIRVLFVCMGNICRSPTAEGVFKYYVAEAGLADRIASDSAGTHDFHIGEPADPRAQQAASRRGYDLSPLRGRQVSPRDFADFDYVLAMDETILRALERRCPSQYTHKVKLFMEFGFDAGAREVPDPYSGGLEGFEQVLDMVEQAAQGLLLYLRARIDS